MSQASYQIALSRYNHSNHPGSCYGCTSLLITHRHFPFSHLGDTSTSAFFLPKCFLIRETKYGAIIDFLDIYTHQPSDQISGTGLEPVTPPWKGGDLDHLSNRTYLMGDVAVNSHRASSTLCLFSCNLHLHIQLKWILQRSTSHQQFCRFWNRTKFFFIRTSKTFNPRLLWDSHY